jgi:hypothetical protein
MRTKFGSKKDDDARERKRIAALNELRIALADLDGLSVGRVSYRAGRMIIWLRPRDRQEPVLAIKLRGLAEFRDNGIGGTRLIRGMVLEGGAMARNLAENRERPEFRSFLQLDLWNNLSKNGPAFQALAKHIKVFQGERLSPDRVWES